MATGSKHHHVSRHGSVSCVALAFVLDEACARAPTEATHVGKYTTAAQGLSEHWFWCTSGGRPLMLGSLGDRYVPSTRVALVAGAVTLAVMSTQLCVIMQSCITPDHDSPVIILRS